LAITCGITGTAFAQRPEWPAKPIKMLVPFGAGGAADVAARLFAEYLGQALGQQFVVENRTGGGGLIAAEHVLSSPPDGYTVYVASHGSQAIHPHLTKLSFDPMKAFAPVIYLATTPTLLVMHPSVPAKTLQELIALLKANPGKYTYASQGNGSSGHVTAEQFRQLTGVDIVHVPYKGAAPAVRDLVAGHVSMMFDTVAFSQEQVLAGKLRAVAVGADARVKSLPDVPTMAEAGLPAMQGSPWFGLVVVAGTPRPVIDWLNREATRAFTAKDVQDRFDAQAFTLPLGSPEAFAAHIATESKRWGEVIRRGKIALK
jgi:tripartite-type tricarboxylate transporter receptor subunit TctC